jgi:hypothetical protein
METSFADDEGPQPATRNAAQTNIATSEANRLDRNISRSNHPRLGNPWCAATS